MGNKQARYQSILDRLGRERMRPYLFLAEGNGKYSLDLYRWNIEISAAFLELIAIVEIIVRNSFHEQLSTWCGQRSSNPYWLTNLEELPQPLSQLFSSVKSGAVSAAIDAKVNEIRILSTYDPNDLFRKVTCYPRSALASGTT